MEDEVEKFLAVFYSLIFLGRAGKLNKNLRGNIDVRSESAERM